MTAQLHPALERAHIKARAATGTGGCRLLAKDIGLAPDDRIVRALQREWQDTLDAVSMRHIMLRCVADAVFFGALERPPTAVEFTHACVEYLSRIEDADIEDWRDSLEVRSSLRALSQLVRDLPEFRAHPELPSLLCDASLSAQSAPVRHGMVEVLSTWCDATASSPDDGLKARLEEVLAHGEAITPTQWIRISRHAGLVGWERVEAGVLDPNAEIDLVHLWLDWLTAHDPFEEAWLTLKRALRRGNWRFRRALLVRLGPGHDVAVPTLSAMTKHSGANDVLFGDLVRAFARIGAQSAEPALHRLAMHDSDVVAIHAIEVLRDLGTRASMATLVRTGDAHTTRREAAKRAIEVIALRHPTGATAGSLSLADHDDVQGALSLAGAASGDLSLAQHAQTRPDSAPPHAGAEEDELAPTDILLPTSGIYEMDPAPRRLPLRIGLAMPFVAGWRASRHTRELLQLGQPVYAEFLSQEFVGNVFDPRVQERATTYALMNAHGSQRTETFRHQSKDEHEPVDGARPALYHKGELVFLEDVPGIEVAKDGALRLTHPRSVMLAGTLYALFLASPVLILLSLAIATSL